VTLEGQLWLWLDACEAQKPRAIASLEHGDRVVRALQYGVREGREASEAGDHTVGLSSKTQ